MSKISKPFIGSVKMGVHAIDIQDQKCEGFVYAIDVHDPDDGHMDIRVPIMLNDFGVEIDPMAMLDKYKMYYIQFNTYFGNLILDKPFRSHDEAKEKAEELIEEVLHAEDFDIIRLDEIT